MDQDTARRHILDLYEVYTTAYVAGDYETAASLLDNPFDCVIHTANGKRLSYDDFMENLRVRVGKYRSYTIRLHDDLHQEGDKWVASFTEEFYGRRPSMETGEEVEVHELAVTRDTFTPRQGRWSFAGSHLIAVRKEENGVVVLENVPEGVSF